MVLNINDINKIVINLPERQDRLIQFKSEVNHLGWQFEVMDGIKHKEPMTGIGMAHRKCVLIANNLNLDNILIMEDDLLFTNASKTQQYIKEALNNTPDDFDVLIGGHYGGVKLSNYNDYWHRVGQFCGLHFYIVNKRFYQHILNYDGTMHIDRYMNLQETNKVYCTNKFFAIQRDGYSDNVKNVTEYSKYLNHKLFL